jgi:hypothetical protein
MDGTTRIDIESTDPADDANAPIDHGQVGKASIARSDKVWQITVGSEIELCVKELIRRRRERSDFFPARLFGDPAWDILLALTLAYCRQRRMTVTNLCNSVEAPMTTSLRWIQLMTDAGHLIRRNDVNDRRRRFIELSPSALERMIEYCSRQSTPHALAA